MSAISCSRSFWRSSSAFRSSSRFGARRPCLRLWCLPHMVTSLLSTIEKIGESVAQPLDGLEPRRKHVVTLLRQGVRALRRTGQIGAPLGGDEPLVLEGAQCPVQVPDVDPILAGELGQRLEKLVTMCRPAREQEEKRRLAEALHARTNLPLALLVAVAVPGSKSTSAVAHDHSICKLHMSVTSRAQTRAARFASMPASSVANESENFCTPSASRVAVTSS